MEKLGLDLDDGSSPTDTKQVNPTVSTIFLLIYLCNLIPLIFTRESYRNSACR